MTQPSSHQLADAPLPQGVSIAFAHRVEQVGGIETWAANCCAAFREGGRNGVLLSYRNPLHPDVSLGDPAIPTLDCGINLTRAHFGKALTSHQRALPAVFVPHPITSSYVACAQLSREHAAQMRIVGMCHSFDPFSFLVLQHFEPIIHRFIAVSDECGRELARRIPSRRSDILVRPYGIRVPATLSRTYAPPERPLRLLYAGRIVQPQKRILDLLPLASALHSRGTNFHLRIVGEGAEKPVLVQRLSELPAAVAQRITVQPAVAPRQMPHLLRDHDVAVLVSDFEGTSIFMLEAMAQGCIPIVTDVSGTAAVIEHSVNGFRFTPGDLNAMAGCIGTLAADRQHLGALGRAAHGSVQRFSLEQYIRWFGSIADDLWRQPPRIWPPRGSLRGPAQFHFHRAKLRIARNRFARRLWRLLNERRTRADAQ